MASSIPDSGEQSPQLPDHLTRIFEDIAVGAATKVVSAGVGLSLPAAIQLPCVARLVAAIIVELYRQLKQWPPAIDVPTSCRPIRLRKRKAELFQELEKPLLESTQRDLHIAPEDPTQVGRARAIGASSKHQLDPGGRRPVANPGLVARSSQVVQGQNRGQVNECSGDRRDRNPAVASRRSKPRACRVLIPSIRRSFGVVTSGGGCTPSINRHKKPAANPPRSAPSPQAYTAAR